jgi:DNA polymerase-3 subunit delta'
VAFAEADAFDLLRRAHANGRFAHAYLFTGTSGSGKRKLVQRLCGLLLNRPDDPLKHPDLHLLEPESKSRRIRIEAVRELERRLQMRSRCGGPKIAVLFDAERLVESAANAFLKTLEEPPANSHLFLTSSLPDQLPVTIRSRCLEMRLRPAGRHQPSSIENDLLDALRTFASEPAADLPQVFFLARRFQELLGTVRQRIHEESEAAFKKEENIYKQVGNKEALDEREDYYKALVESRYLAERSSLLGTVEQWWADALRQNACTAESDSAQPPLDHPQCAAETAAMARRFTAAQLLRKSGALQTLRDQLERNVQEQLAIEAGFLNVFAGETDRS